MAVKPISPKEAGRGPAIPDIVIETVNRHLQRHGNSERITLPQAALVDDLVSQGLDREEIYDKGWLDFENLYRDQGWDVEYEDRKSVV